MSKLLSIFRFNFLMASKDTLS